MNQSIESVIRTIVSNDGIFIDEPMKKHTTFRIGGSVDILVKPDSTDQIRDVISVCKNMGVPYYIMGNGSNILVPDDGIRGVVVMILDNYSGITVEGNVIKAQAGALLSAIGRVALDNSLAGFEFACGIPGTLGGACIMNAGAFGGEMKDVIVSVTAMDGEGNVRDYSPDEMELSYRSSIFDKKGLTVLEACIELREGRYDDITTRINELAAVRREKQPLDMPSAGSAFKRPEGYFAGKLIMDAGLRGFRVGDAAISEKHCGFVVNLGNATADDVRGLMKQVSDNVYGQFGVRLEPEIRFL